MAHEGIATAWSRLGRLACQRVLHLQRFGKPWETWGVHWHSVPTLVIPLLGCSLLDVDDRQILPLTPGTIVLVDPWVWHIHRTPHPGGLTLLISRTGAIAEVELWNDQSVWYGDLPWDLVQRDIQAMARGRSGTRQRDAAQRLLATLGNHPAPAARHLSAPLQAMCSFAWRMRTQHITAAQILAASGLSYAVAHELFVGRFGETPKQYLLRCRLDLARHLLMRGGQPGTVWREAGFASRADLTRRFRLVVGLAPLAWLKQHRATPAATKRPSRSPMSGTGL
jgi:AraC-like DNA-binding protein